MGADQSQLAVALSPLNPERTVLFLGAGASIPSGGLSGPDLAQRLIKLLHADGFESDDLAETATVLQNRYGRLKVLEALRDELATLRPTGALLSLPEYPWSAIYSTNFDTLVEQAYSATSHALTVVRSNYDWQLQEDADETVLYKIHGCITQDEAFGHKARLTLSQEDYELYPRYREALFSKLTLDLLTKDILIIGQSLADRHLRDEVIRVTQLQGSHGAPGRVFLLSYSHDDDRATLFRNRGVSVMFGSLDTLAAALADRESLPTAQRAPEAEGAFLPRQLRHATIDTAHAAQLNPNPVRLFNGSPATYADVAAGLTIERAGELGMVSALESRARASLVIVGVAGVGKTTLARRVVHALAKLGWRSWEHGPEFTLQERDWLRVEQKLRDNNERGVLLVDDCPPMLAALNGLVTRLSELDDPHLAIVATAPRALWSSRIKSPAFFSRGDIEMLSELADADIYQLIGLLDRQSQIGNLVEKSFANLSRGDKFRRLRERCEADMYVCLKNIFATVGLDDILLREYAELGDSLQDIYRHVAALEASGTHVHRQLVMRLVGIEASDIEPMLELLGGLVEEYDVAPSEGLYGWATRHRVIAETITRYKFSGMDERFELLTHVVANINPAVRMERATIRDLCNSEFGIRGLGSREQQIALYRGLVEVAPAERVPRHRLIKAFLDLEDMELASQAIRDAEKAAGIDPPIAGYKVRLALMRAEKTPGVMPEDRRAMLRDAERLALIALERFPTDMHAFVTYGDVGIAVARRFKDTSVLSDATNRASEAAEILLDPRLADGVVRLRREMARFGGA